MNLNTSNEDLLEFHTQHLHISILGGIKLSSLDRLRVTLKLQALKPENTPEDYLSPFPLRYNIDLYNSDQTEKLIRRLADYFELELKQVRADLMALISELEAYRLSKLQARVNPARQAKNLSEAEINTAINYLKQKNLLSKLNEDIGKSGIIGEELNRLLLYIVFTSRKLSSPLHAIILGSSGQGKTHLQEKVAELIPDEDKIEITSLTHTSLYYFEPHELHHKLLLIEDLDGASQEALYTLRELQSKKRITRTITTKNAKGLPGTQRFTVEGIVSISATTTRDSVYEDNSNRSIIMHVDTSKEQDIRIMNFQKALSIGHVHKASQLALKQRLQDVQRVLKPIAIRNPYADHLELPASIYNPRRSMSIYLSCIEAITFLHQFQRPIKKDQEKQPYIESSIEDISHANHLLKEVFLRKSDELSAAARQTLEKIKACLKDQKQTVFYTRDIKQLLKFNPNNLKRHLKELEIAGYIRVQSGSRYLGYEYKIVSAEEFKLLQQTIDNSFKRQLQALKNLPK